MLRWTAPLVLFIALATVGSSSAARSDSCPSSNPANTLKIVSGSAQTAQLGKQFQANLQVALANTNGCPVTGNLAGVGVDFVAPSSGASGVFASSGSNSVVVGTDANGIAVAPAFTANDTAGSYSVHAESDYGTVLLYLTNTSRGVVTSIAATGGTTQSATVNSVYGAPLQAQVQDADGLPVQGVTIVFSLGAGTSGAGASFLGGAAQASVVTNSAGQATSPAVVANGTPGRFTATASTAGVSAVATYSLDNHATRTTLAAVAPSSQTATVGRRYALPLQVRVLDATGSPIEGASVTFALASATGGAGASFVGGGTQATALTDENGQATSPPLVANATAGRFGASATAAGVSEPLAFSLRNVAAVPKTITAGPAATESTTVGTQFPIRLAVTVTDENKNPVAGAVVTFTAPARGPSGRFGGSHSRTARVTTGADGVAVAPAFAANAETGGFVVTVSVRGAGHPAAFALVNRPLR
jgi:protocatechuate 3,4-dioxygenase beta subunit